MKHIELVAYEDKECLCEDGKVTCYQCKGTGKEDVKGWAEYGTPYGEDDYKGVCRLCKGSKKIICDTCRGQGYYKRETRVSLKGLKKLMEEIK